MIAFEVSVNGKRICVAGAEDLSVLNAGVTAVGKLGDKTFEKRKRKRDKDLFFSVGGLISREDSRKDMHLTWNDGNGISPLKVGDVVEVRIIESSNADPPKSSRSAEKVRTRAAKRPNSATPDR